MRLATMAMTPTLMNIDDGDYAEVVTMTMMDNATTTTKILMMSNFAMTVMLLMVYTH